MPSTAFLEAKDKGRDFELALIPVLEEKGMKVIDTDSWSYRLKKGMDLMVEVQGLRNGIECKLDMLSERTRRVCIDLDSITKTTSSIWIIGLPHSSQVDCYATKIADLAPFTYQYAKDHPEAVKRVGEFKQSCVMIPKRIFTILPFVNKFKTINFK